MDGAPIVDVHAHPGRFPRATAGELPLAALAEMRSAGVRCAFFAAVGDGAVLRVEGRRIRSYREPGPGELHASTLGQLERVRVRAREGHLRLVAGRRDLTGLVRDAGPAALLAVEGGDPLEGRIDRVQALHAVGVRSIQLVHYRINELGDIQTEPPRHGGLTDAGAAVVHEMNRLGMVVDGAHAAAATLRGIVETSRHPIVVSHTGPAARRSFARHLTDDLLRVVAARGGVIGVWPIARQPGAPLDDFLADLRHVV
ncbi:MAG: membrane dipeptidase, partial [Candidatus Rokubacteria bacterium]|nr:membrane dipeptidase [Candidatus Rokubacteria bacterium]